MMIRMPEIESIRLWAASLVIAREPEISPMMTLKTASRKLVKIKSQPALIMALLLVLSVFAMMIF